MLKMKARQRFKISTQCFAGFISLLVLFKVIQIITVALETGNIHTLRFNLHHLFGPLRKLSRYVLNTKSKWNLIKW